VPIKVVSGVELANMRTAMRCPATPPPEKKDNGSAACERPAPRRITTTADLYVNWAHEWDKAWDTDNHLVQVSPGEPYGWVMRAEIQKQQPRAGLQDTVDYFAAHFDVDPRAHKMLLDMRTALALQSRPVSQADQHTSEPRVSASMRSSAACYVMSIQPRRE